MSPALPRWRWALYLLPALLGVLPTLLSPGFIVGDGVDAYGTGWFFWWIRTCVTHFGDPSWTPLFFAPDGKNIFADTGNNFVDAIFSIPFQMLFGQSWSGPFTIFLLLGNAWSFEQLAKELWSDTRDVVAATAAWTVNPYVIFELTAGRPTQAVMWWFPLAVLMLRRICLGDRTIRTAASLGAATALTAWTYWFAGYFLAFLLLPLGLWWSRSGHRLAAFRSIVIGAVVCTILVAPMAVGMAIVWDEGLVPGVNGVGPEGANVDADLHGVWLMETRGAPLLIQPAWLMAALTGAVVGKRDGRIWFGIAAALITIGLGARLGGGRLVNPVWSVVSDLPFLARLWFPYRITMVVMLPWTVLAVLAWQRFGRRPVLALIFLTFSLAGEAFSGTFPFNNKDAACPKLVMDAAKEPGTVLVLPGGIQSDVLLWQTQFQRPMFAGMGESARAFWPSGYANRRHNSWIKALQESAASPNRPHVEPTGDRSALTQLGIRWVLLRRDLIIGIWRNERSRGSKEVLRGRDAKAMAHLTGLLGTPAAADHRLVLWDVLGTYTDPASPATAEKLDTAPLDEEARPGFERGMIRMHRMPE
ncbi:MAG: hypothetical protein EXR69_08865 [Myxococcales bacterium]|nr:hypothetical protein [Myxococcales bacterium]